MRRTLAALAAIVLAACTSSTTYVTYAPPERDAGPDDAGPTLRQDVSAPTDGAAPRADAGDAGDAGHDAGTGFGNPCDPATGAGCPAWIYPPPGPGDSEGPQRALCWDVPDKARGTCGFMCPAGDPGAAQLCRLVGGVGCPGRCTVP